MFQKLITYDKTSAEGKTKTESSFFIFFCCLFCPFCYRIFGSDLCISDGHLNLNSRLNADGGDLLDSFRWTVQIDQALVDPHLETIPGLGTLSTRCLTGSDAQNLGWHSHRSLHFQELIFGFLDQISTHCNQNSINCRHHQSRIK